MATKNCPTCSKQVPVACKKCVCGHIFFSTRKGAGASAASASTAKDFTQLQQDMLSENFGEFQPIRRTGRRPEKPKFYDALQYENQTRKKQLLRRQTKGSKPDENTTSAKGAAPRIEDKETVAESPAPLKEVKSDPEPGKRRRGRPPGINGKKARIAINHKPTRSNALHKPKDPVNANNGSLTEGNADEEDLMADITPEKAVQYNIILNEINRKLASSSWKA